MLNAHNLNIAALAASEESRFTLNGILVAPDRTVVTDGHCLVQVTTPTENGDVSSFPEIPGMGEVTDKFKPFIMPRAAALGLAKAIPRKTTIPVLCHAAVASSSNADIVTMGCTDLEKSTVLPIRPLAGNFPDVSRAVPKEDDAIFAIGLNLQLLTNVLSVITKMHHNASAKAHSGPAATFRFYGHDKAVRIDFHNSETGQDVMAVVMPMRMDDNIKLKCGGIESIIAKMAETRSAQVEASVEAAPVEPKKTKRGKRPIAEPASASGACIVTPENAATEDDCTTHDHEAESAPAAPSDVPPLSAAALESIMQLTGMPFDSVMRFAVLNTDRLTEILGKCKEFYAKADDKGKAAVDLNMRIVEGILEDRAVAA